MGTADKGRQRISKQQADPEATPCPWCPERRLPRAVSCGGVCWLPFPTPNTPGPGVWVVPLSGAKAGSLLGRSASPKGLGTRNVNGAQRALSPPVMAFLERPLVGWSCGEPSGCLTARGHRLWGPTCQRRLLGDKASSFLLRGECVQGAGWAGPRSGHGGHQRGFLVAWSLLTLPGGLGWTPPSDPGPSFPVRLWGHPVRLWGHPVRDKSKGHSGKAICVPQGFPAQARGHLPVNVSLARGVPVIQPPRGALQG